ncbi:MAG: YbaK/EbsC family protein [Candidatus Aminicenantes bacterium]|nr:YbaK/EbsC family protein [Candidatus Aminicenantes bacterium]
MPIKKLKDFLDKNKVKYVAVSHSKAFTAMEIAASAHIAGRELAKTVMIKIDGRMAMAVLPASHRVDFELLKKALKATQVEIANESEFKGLFPDCELGAMPPFGNLYDLDVYTAQSLAEDEEIAFNAGSFTELIKLSFKDYEKLVKPTLLKFSAPR